MAKLRRFSTPARVPDRHPGRWSDTVAATLRPYVGRFPQFYDPTATDTPSVAKAPMISWSAFPAVLRVTNPPPLERWRLADRDRALQDEYCEWSVERNRMGKITGIVFSTELPEYWEHLFETDPNRLLSLYRKLVDVRVKLSDLRAPGGGYRPENRWNTRRPGRLAHMIQDTNKLGAAVDLVARATIPRVKNGRPVTDQQELVRCGRLGEPLRHSDPQIAAAVNRAARGGSEITFADPVGLYLGRPLTAGMVTPDGTDAAKFWKVERGNAQQALRARFEVPASKGYVIGDIEIGGRPIEFGGQVAERVQVWVSARIKQGNHDPAPRPCRRG
ncbi:MAG: hypothetical protein WD399_05155 [Thermoleophilaceae bacterium]